MRISDPSTALRTGFGLRIERRNGTGFNAEIAEACPERAACPEPVEGSEPKGRRGGTEGLGDWVTGDGIFDCGTAVTSRCFNSSLKPHASSPPSKRVAGNRGCFQRRERGERRGETAVPSSGFRVPSERQTATDIRRERRERWR